MEHGRAINKICARHFKTSAQQLITSCVAMQPRSLEGTLTIKYWLELKKDQQIASGSMKCCSIEKDEKT